MKVHVGLVLLVLAAGCRPEPAPRDLAMDLESLLAAERAFARTSVASGMGHAFLAYLAEEAIIFRPGPTDGRAWFAGRPETPGTLDWAPVLADVADTGDLGYTSGPWSFADSTGTPVAYGHYVSVWRRQADSTWRVEIDAGITHAVPDEPETDRVAWLRDSTQSKELRLLYIEAARVALLKADRDLAKASAERGSATAFRDVLTDSVRLYRDGTFPQIGKARMEERLDRDGGVLTWVPITAAVSRAGDLGYTYGLSTFRAAADDTTTVTSSYLRLWKAPPGGPWRLILDLASPIPAGAE